MRSLKLLLCVLLPGGLAVGCSGSGGDPTPWAGGCAEAGATALVFVPEDCSTLGEAVEAITEGGTVDISPGVYSEDIEIGKDVILTSRGGAGAAILDATSSPSAISISAGNVAITGLTISGATEHAIMATGGSVTLESVVIQDNRGGSGVGLYLQGAAATLNEVTIQRGVAETHGAAVELVDATATFTDVSIVDNDASGGPGAALYLSGASSLTMEGGVISGNSGGTVGGLVYSASPGGGGPSLQGVTLENNTITSGPIFYMSGGGFGLIGASFSGESRGIFAGEVSALNLRRVDIADSGAIDGVAPIDLVVGSANIEDLTFEDNAGPEGGWVMRPDGTGEVVLTDVVIQDNTGGAKAGGMFLSCAEVETAVTFNNVQVVGNRIDGDAGAGGMRVERCALTGGSIVDNVGPYGGGVGMFDGASLSQAIVAGNTSLNDGGGVYIGAPSGVAYNLGLSGVWFSGNVTAQYGGGVYLRGSPAQFNNLVFTKQSARVGASIYTYSATLAVSHSSFIDNQAEDGPAGGIFSDIGSLTVDHSLFTQNDSANPDRDNVYIKSGTATGSYNIYFGEGENDGVDRLTLSTTDIVAAPKLVGVAEDGLWTWDAVHLQLNSPAVDAGNPNGTDPDGSRADIGAFSGEGAGVFDLDGDGVHGYWWPGGYATPPSGVAASQWDCDDLDAESTCG